MGKMKMNKRAQEEMVGFVLIVVLVAVAFLVFLGISLRQNDSSLETESKDIYQFLESLMELTTNCSIDSETNFYKVSDIIERCYSKEGQLCVSGEKVCEVMNNTLKEALESSWTVHGQGFYKGYAFLADYTENAEEGIALGSGRISSRKYFPIVLNSGDCDTPGVIGNEYLIPSRPGVIIVELKICIQGLASSSDSA